MRLLSLQSISTALLFLSLLSQALTHDEDGDSSKKKTLIQSFKKAATIISDDILDDGIYDQVADESPPLYTRKVKKSNIGEGDDEDDKLELIIRRLKSRRPSSSNSTAPPILRPPIFLIPGLGASRLIAWKHKTCPTYISPIKLNDGIWLNVNKLLEMSTHPSRSHRSPAITCWIDCMKLEFPSEDDPEDCKIRAGEGLDAVNSLAPRSFKSDLIVGETNTVYAWLNMWLAETLGYDVTNLIALPYDFRLSNRKLQDRDGFFTNMKKKLEASVTTAGRPGIMIAHSMGNIVFRWFLEWLKCEFRKEAVLKYTTATTTATLPGWLSGVTSMASEMKLPEVPKEVKSYISRVTEMASEMYLPVPEEVKSYLGHFGRMYDAAKSVLPFTKDNSVDVIEKVSVFEHQIPLPSAVPPLQESSSSSLRESKFLDLAYKEADIKYKQWVTNHIWSYVGLAAPLLGAVNPIRAVLSGENMGIPISEAQARELELTFGSTSTTLTLSTNSSNSNSKKEEVLKAIQESNASDDVWDNLETLKALVKDNIDWDTSFPILSITAENGDGGSKGRYVNKSNTVDDKSDPLLATFGPSRIQNGEFLDEVSEIWKEKESKLKVKKMQFDEAFGNDEIDILSSTWERPPIKHVIMAYGVDISTEIGYVYSKIKQKNATVDSDDEILTNDETTTVEEENCDGMPFLSEVLWEGPGGVHVAQEIESSMRQTLASKLFGSSKKKMKKRQAIDSNSTDTEKRLKHSGDGTIPYLSLAWSKMWLLDTFKSKSKTNGKEVENPLDLISVTKKEAGSSDWVSVRKTKMRKMLESSEFCSVDDIDDCGACGCVMKTAKKIRKKSNNTDSGKSEMHPHVTTRLCEIFKYQVNHMQKQKRGGGEGRTTTILEVSGVEHKEITRNYDVLAAVFSEVLSFADEDQE